MILAEPLRHRPAPVELRKECTFFGLHDVALFGLGVVVAKHVEQPVDDEQRYFVVCGAGMFFCLTKRHGRAYDHITEKHWHIIGVDRRSVGTNARGHGVPTHVHFGIYGEREHVHGQRSRP